METKEEMIPYPGPTMVLRTIIDTMLKSDDILVRNQADLAKYELEELEERVGDLETALKCANVCNETKEYPRAWAVTSPFQKKIEELVGKPPYGEEEK